MPRKRLDPSIRFDDVVPVWETVLRDNGAVLRTNSDNETIALVYRLNQYRKIVREDAVMGWTELDRYVVRRGNLCVEIERRMPIDLTKRMTKLDGSPSTTAPTTRATPFDDFAAQAAKGSFIEQDEGLTREQQEMVRQVNKNLERKVQP